MKAHHLLLCVGLLLCIQGSLGLIETLKIDKDPRTLFHIESFGFEQDGIISMEMSDFWISVPVHFQRKDSYDIAFVLQRSTLPVDEPMEGELMDGNEEGSGAYCYHKNFEAGDDENIVISLADREDWNQLEYDHAINTPGYYHLYFSNCEADTLAHFELTLTEFNVEADGTLIFLSSGDHNLPSILFFLCFLFITALLCWVYLLNTDRQSVKAIHWMMTAVLALKVCTLFFEAFKYHTMKYTGQHDYMSEIYFFFAFLKGLMMFSVVVLIGTGWSYTKPYLTDRDKLIIVSVLVTQLMMNIALVMLDYLPPGDAEWINWSDALHLLDMVCCCIILLPIVSSIKQLREARSVDGKAEKNLQRLKNFRTFYLLVISYVYFTRIIVYLLSATLPYELTYLSLTFNELASLVFYVITGVLFRPQPNNPYLRMRYSDDEEEGGGHGQRRTDLESRRTHDPSSYVDELGSVELAL